MIKNYLQAYNWIDYLPIAEFVASNHVNTSTDMTTFFADYRFHPCTGIKLSGTFKSEQKTKLLAANKIICRQEKMIMFVQDQLTWSQDKQT